MFNILLLESDSLMSDGIKRVIESLKIKINIEDFEGPAEAFEASQNKQYDYFIITVNSVKDANLEFARKIRELTQYQITFIVFLVKNNFEKVQDVITDEFDCYRIIKAPMTKKKEEILRTTVLRVASHEINNLSDKSLRLVRENVVESYLYSDIVWIDIEKKEVTLNLRSGKKVVFLQSNYPIKRLTAMLGNGFIRVYRSSIINREYVVDVDLAEKLIWVNSESGSTAFKIGCTYESDVRRMIAREDG